MQGFYFDELSLGQSAELTRVVDAADIEAFAKVSGDANPVHLDETYARTTMFGTRIAHGMLAASYISAVMAMKMPGPGVVYMSQSLKFRRPVKIGDAVTARVTITALDAAKGRATLQTVCQVDGRNVLEGEALVMVPRRAA